MDDKPEAGFLEFNRNNIFENLLQAEDHLKRVVEDHGHDSGEMIAALDHIQCVVKHLSMAKAESSEAQAHTLNNNPQDFASYQSLTDMLNRTREAILAKNTTIPEIIKDVRAARSFFEKFNQGFDVSKCRACSLSENIKTEITPQQFCNMTKHPDQCLEMIRKLESGEPRDQDIQDLLKGLKLTSSMLNNIGKLNSYAMGE